MRYLSHTQKQQLEKIGTIVLALLCIASIIWFIINAQILYRSGELQPGYMGRHGDHHMLTVNAIQPWMTFNYLNVVFNLPVQYLQTTLSITDPHYPNIRIGSYLQDTQQAITHYMTKQ
jgi:hypothetical protein